CFLLGTLTGCSDILSQKPLNAISGPAVWNDPALMQANLNDIYKGMGHGLNETMLASLSDDAMFIHGYGTFGVVQSKVTPSDMKALHNGRYGYLQWDNLYSRIRQANIFLKKSSDYSGTAEDKVNRMRGQAHFL